MEDINNRIFPSCHLPAAGLGLRPHIHTCGSHMLEFTPNKQEQGRWHSVRNSSQTSLHYRNTGNYCRPLHCCRPSVPDMSVAQHDEFLAGQSVEAHRAARMYFVRGNTDFGAKTIFETIGKTSGSIHHHRA